MNALHPWAAPVGGQGESDAAYFRRRAREEQAIAAQAGDERARTLHLELADRYASLSAAIRETEERFG